MYSQKNVVWCFGDSAGMDFTTTPPSTFISQVKSRGSCASVSDSIGNLQFYAFTQTGIGNTGLIFSHDHQLMQNGNSIVGEAWYQEMTIIPDPGNIYRYYLFSVGVAGNSQSGLYYSVIDMSMNNGLGAVLLKNIQLNNFKSVDCILAIKHGNGRDWWIIFKRSDILNNDFYKYLVTPAGISIANFQSIGDSTATNNIRFNASLNGKKFAKVSYQGNIEIAEFDRCNGNLFNYRTIRHANPSSPYPELVGFEFSLNTNYLYITTNGFYSDRLLFQLNLQDSLPLLTSDTVYSNNFPLGAGGFIKLAPDSKIYWSCAWDDGVSFNYPYPDTTYNLYNSWLGVINNPDSSGAACDLQPYSFYLGGARTYYGLPNNPNYELGPDSGSVCDTLTTSIQSILTDDKKFFVLYHRDWQMAFINAEGLIGRSYTLIINDITGRCIFKESGQLQNAYFTKDLELQSFSKGLYIVTLLTNKERFSQKLVKE